MIENNEEVTFPFLIGKVLTFPNVSRDFLYSSMFPFLIGKVLTGRIIGCKRFALV